MTLLSFPAVVPIYLGNDWIAEWGFCSYDIYLKVILFVCGYSFFATILVRIKNIINTTIIAIIIPIFKDCCKKGTTFVKASIKSKAVFDFFCMIYSFLSFSIFANYIEKIIILVKFKLIKYRYV